MRSAFRLRSFSAPCCYWLNGAPETTGPIRTSVQIGLASSGISAVDAKMVRTDAIDRCAWFTGLARQGQHTASRRDLFKRSGCPVGVRRCS
jgi:hypothetical protein